MRAMNITITDETTVIRMYVRINYSIHNEPHEMKIKKMLSTKYLLHKTLFMSHKFLI